MKISDDIKRNAAFNRGYCHGRRGYFYDPFWNYTTDQRALYRAGFNYARNQSVYLQMTKDQRKAFNRMNSGKTRVPPSGAVKV